MITKTECFSILAGGNLSSWRGSWNDSEILQWLGLADVRGTCSSRLHGTIQAILGRRAVGFLPFSIVAKPISGTFPVSTRRWWTLLTQTSDYATESESCCRRYSFWRDGRDRSETSTYYRSAAPECLVYLLLWKRFYLCFEKLVYLCMNVLLKT